MNVGISTCVAGQKGYPAERVAGHSVVKVQSNIQENYGWHTHNKVWLGYIEERMQWFLDDSALMLLMLNFNPHMKLKCFVQSASWQILKVQITIKCNLYRYCKQPLRAKCQAYIEDGWTCDVLQQGPYYWFLVMIWCCMLYYVILHYCVIWWYLAPPNDLQQNLLLAMAVTVPTLGGSGASLASTCTTKRGDSKGTWLQVSALCRRRAWIYLIS